MFEVSFGGLPLACTHSAYGELRDLGLDLGEIRESLEFGFNCSRSRRKKGILERCLRRGSKVLRVVVARGFNEFLERECWVVIHVSIQSWNRKMAQKAREKGNEVL